MLEGQACGLLSVSFVAEPKAFLDTWPCCAEGEHLSLNLDLSSAKKQSKKPIWYVTEMHTAEGCWNAQGPPVQRRAVRFCPAQRSPGLVGNTASLHLLNKSLTLPPSSFSSTFNPLIHY